MRAILQGGLYLEGRFADGFLRYRIGGLIFGGAYIHGGAYFWNFTAFAETFHGTQIWGLKYIVKTCWFTLIVLFKLENDYKRVSFVIFLIA